MKRSIIQQRNSFTITLPKKWIERNGLINGGEISLEESEEGNLIIYPGADQHIVEKHLILETHNASRLRTIIAGLYRRGYDKITIESPQEFDLLTIETLIQTLSGLLLTQFTKNSIELECTIAVPQDIGNHLNKFFITAAYIFEHKKTLTSEDLKAFRRQNLEQRDYFSRCINKTSYGADKETEFHLLVFFLEKFISSVATLSVRESNINLKPHIDDLRKALTKKDIALAQKTNHALSDLLKKRLTKDELLMCDHLFSVSSRILSIVA